ncbi:hypothetical protein B0H13DRAFT_1904449 [Mycena leptocephala]|nr:hypothetical protein B0H13DRAFT_1904449 [Mycena leptocephala]
MEIDEEPEIKKSHVKPDTKTGTESQTPTKNISKTLPSDDDYNYDADAWTSEGKPTSKDAIIIQKRRDSVLRLARKCRWPEAIDWNEARDRTFKMKDSIVDFFHNSAKSDACPVRDQFPLAIDYKLLDFSESKQSRLSMLLSAANAAGSSYGPQGEFVIYSSLLRLISELEQDQEKLEQDLSSTLHTVIKLASSNYLSLDDFIHFFLVHAVATFMTLQGFDDPHDTMFERSNSNEYGRSRQNWILLLRATENRFTSKRRRNTDFKNSYPPAAVVEEEITLDVFRLPAKKAAKLRPKPRPKTRSDKPVVKVRHIHDLGLKSKSLQLRDALQEQGKEDEDLMGVFFPFEEVLGACALLHDLKLELELPLKLF